MLPEIWSFLESEGGVLRGTARKMAAEASRTARIFHGTAAGFVFGPPGPRLLGELKPYGLPKIYLSPARPQLSPEGIAAAIAAAAVRWRPVGLLFDNLPLGAEVAARAAASLERGLVANCIEFELDGEQPVARKTVYGGRAHALYTWNTPPPYLATVDTTALEDLKAGTPIEPEVVPIAAAEAEPLTGLTGKWEMDLADLDLSEARVVIGVGRGVDGSDMEHINRLAEILRGVIGGSRIAVYKGLVGLERQIGTTGKWLDSDLYLAIGISGAPQHVMGIKEVKNIIAINISKQAPIFKYAGLGVVGDLRQVVPELVKMLEARGKGPA
jgi:electron transfer flavoprotein alpha subunit